MDTVLRKAFTVGYERMAGWSELLDRINIFPVADSDTGANLKISLAPLRCLDKNPHEFVQDLLFSAAGNSGNIAAAFFSELLRVDSLSDIPSAVRAGRKNAWGAISDPKSGTILTILDELAAALTEIDINEIQIRLADIINRIEDAVHSTQNILPVLRQAGVVDAGALGIFLCLEGFFWALAGKTEAFRSVTEMFKDSSHVLPSFTAEIQPGYCVNALLKTDHLDSHTGKDLAVNGESIIAIQDKKHLKIHLHTRDRKLARQELEAVGNIAQWQDTLLSSNSAAALSSDAAGQGVHIMTDAAGSVSRDHAISLGMTLLDSYLIVRDRSWPETLFEPRNLYRAMNNGIRVGTSQASRFERYQSYQSALSLHEHVLYLCAGSAYTGNYDTALAWKRQNDPDDRLIVVDTGAACGRLSVIVLATRQYSRQAKDLPSILDFVQAVIKDSDELIFLDQLKYLSASGRVSRVGGFFGDMFNMKPVVSPTARGAQKIGMVHNREEQLVFALKHLKERLKTGSSPLIMLEYSDNFAWVRDSAKKEIQDLFPVVEIILQPLSLTSGAHMGPGTWAVAFLPGG